MPVPPPSITPRPKLLSRWVSAGIATVVAAAGPVAAQTYPAKPIRLIVPLAVGSTADIGSRFIADQLSKALGQPIIVENRPGAGGTIGTSELARATPDGYTIGLASQGTLVFNQGIYAKPGYDSLKDFAPIALFARTPNVLIVHPSNTASTAVDIVAVAKAKRSTVTFSSGGSGTSHHLSGVLFSLLTAADLAHVPYTSAPRGVLAVMRNEVTIGFFNTPMVLSQIRDGKLKAVGVTSLKRSSLLPNVATLDEQGIKGYEVNTWAGFVAPSGTPSNIVERLNAELSKIFTSAKAKERLASQGFELASPLTPAEFTKLIADDLIRWMPVVKASGAKAD